jgi:tetratricopeptide (TPR) repeat protein
MLLYDETIRVPLLLKLPGQSAAGLRVDSRVRSVDISPTILQVAKLPVPAAMQGQSLMRLLKPKAEGSVVATDRPAFSESIYAHRAFGWSVLRSWRAGKYLYVQAPERELYDQTVDAKAEKNLATSAKAVADTMSGQIEEFQTKTSTAGGGTKTNLDPEQAENLRALGYLPSSGGGSAAVEVGGIDPKSKIQIANLLTDALFDAQERRYEEAVPKLELVLKEEPGTNLAYLELGKALVRLKEYDKALPLLREAVVRLPDDRSSHFELGRALSEMGKWPEAVPEFKQAVDRNPKSPEMRFYLALAYERAGRSQEAMSAYRKTIELKPDDFRANLLLGRQLGLNGRAKEALPYFQKAVKIRPQSIDAHQFLSNAYDGLGQKIAARREREAAQMLRAAAGSSAEPSEVHE